MPARDHAVVRHRGQGDRDAGREGGHVAGHEPEQLKLPGDQQASPDEHGVRHDHPQPIGIHHRSCGSVYCGPSTTKARTSAMLEGLKMCRPFQRMRYLVAIAKATTPMKIKNPCLLHHWP